MLVALILQIRTSDLVFDGEAEQSGRSGLRALELFRKHGTSLMSSLTIQSDNTTTRHLERTLHATYSTQILCAVDQGSSLFHICPCVLLSFTIGSISERHKLVLWSVSPYSNGQLAHDLT